MEHDKLYIQHIITAAKAIEKYRADLSDDGFLNLDNQPIQDGIVRQLEIIGEASKHLSAEIKERNKEIPWREIAGMRDKLIHDYAGIDFSMVLKTVKEDVPNLYACLIREFDNIA